VVFPSTKIGHHEGAMGIRI